MEMRKTCSLLLKTSTINSNYKIPTLKTIISYLNVIIVIDSIPTGKLISIKFSNVKILIINSAFINLIQISTLSNSSLLSTKLINWHGEKYILKFGHSNNCFNVDNAKKTSILTKWINVKNLEKTVMELFIVLLLENNSRKFGKIMMWLYLRTLFHVSKSSFKI